MSWTGNYWGTDGAVAKAKAKFATSDRTPHDRIILASVFYSAVNRTLADIKKFRWSGYRYLNQSLGLALESVSQIDEAWWGELDNAADLKHDADAIDVSCAVYRRYGWMKKGRKSLTHRLLDWGDESLLIENTKPHTLAFLKLHRFAVTPGSLTSEAFKEVYGLAKRAEDDREPEQAVRILRQLADLANKGSPTYVTCLKEAEDLARAVGAVDQLVKMGVNF